MLYCVRQGRSGRKGFQWEEQYTANFLYNLNMQLVPMFKLASLKLFYRWEAGQAPSNFALTPCFPRKEIGKMPRCRLSSSLSLKCKCGRPSDLLVRSWPKRICLRSLLSLRCYHENDVIPTWIGYSLIYQCSW